MNTSLDLCPLCGSTVLYRGMNALECSGIKCENRSKDLKDLKIDFSDVPIDWPWFPGARY